MRKFDLEDRLVEFSTLIMEIVKSLPKTINGIQLARQLSGSGTSVALHYGEAQSAESRRDFIHKMKIVLKELRETFICLKLISKSNILKPQVQLSEALEENNELIAIFVRSIETARLHDSMRRIKVNFKYQIKFESKLHPSHSKLHPSHSLFFIRHSTFYSYSHFNTHRSPVLS